MSKAVKNEMIKDIQQRLGNCRDLVVLDVSKLDGNSNNQLRMGLLKKGIRMLAVKNTFAQQAMQTRGLSLPETCMQGSSTLVTGGEDIVSLSKEIAKWAKQIKTLVIKGGLAEGSPLSAGDVDNLSKSPGRAELISKIAGLILSPGGRLAGALLGPGGYLNGQITAIAEKEESGGGEAAPG